MLLSLEVRAHLELGVQPGPLTLERWPLCLTMGAGVNRQCSGSYFFTDCPTGLSWSLASGWIQFTGSVGETEEQEEEKLGQALSPCSFGFGQWLPHPTAGSLCLGSTGIGS